jgi:integrase
MALWKRGRRYWTCFSVNGVAYRKPLRPPGTTRATTNWQEAVRLERDLIDAAKRGQVSARAEATRLFEAAEIYLTAKAATANSARTVAFDREHLEILKRHFGDTPLVRITRESIEAFQHARRLAGAGNRTVNMNVGVLRQLLKRFGQWRRLEDHVKMLSEAKAPVGRALSADEQQRLFEKATTHPEWEHVYCAAILAANTSMRGVEIKHLRRQDVDLEHGVIHIRRSKNETSHRVLPLNAPAKAAIERMLARADLLGHVIRRTTSGRPAAGIYSTRRSRRRHGTTRGDHCGMPLACRACGSTICVIRSSRSCSKRASPITWSNPSAAICRAGCWSTILISGLRRRSGRSSGWTSPDRRSGDRDWRRSSALD